MILMKKALSIILNTFDLYNLREDKEQIISEQKISRILKLNDGKLLINAKELSIYNP